MKGYVQVYTGNGKGKTTASLGLALRAAGAGLNVYIVILKKYHTESSQVSNETHIGMHDSLFRHSKGLITKSEVRCISLSKLKLISKEHVLWDIGAGSGSISVEASLLNPWGDVYAMEKHPNRIFDIIQNIKNFNCSNIKVLKDNHFDPDVVQIQVSRSKPMPFGDRFEALNPVWIISGSKPEIIRPE